ncbi:MAG: hypothetical protein LC750_04595 [Actinobacteria bacterium]|nr:hypothetical protein [Actinomycetota bacterium]
MDAAFDEVFLTRCARRLNVVRRIAVLVLLGRRVVVRHVRGRAWIPVEHDTAEAEEPNQETDQQKPEHNHESRCWTLAIVRNNRRTRFARGVIVVVMEIRHVDSFLWIRH